MRIKHDYSYHCDYVTVYGANGWEFYISPEDTDLAEDYRWYNEGLGYAMGSGGKYRYKLLHRVIAQRMGLDISQQIDHINLLRNDNTRENLRSASHSQNQHNRTVNKNNTSGFKGVYWNKTAKKWRAQIWVNGKQKFLGYFDTPELAHQAYSQAALLHHKDFANTGHQEQ